MPRHKSILANLVSSFALLTLFLLIGGQAAAQSAIESVDKGRIQTTPAEPADTIPLVSNSATDRTKASPEPLKSEAELMNATGDTKGKLGTTPAPPPPAQCKRTIKADVVALAQPFMLNRLGAAVPNGMIFALKRDTVGGLGKQLRADKRPRPLVLRANVGDCMTITLTNNIPTSKFIVPAPPPAAPGQPYNTSEVSLHIQGMEWVTGPQDDGSFVGKNNSSLATAAPAPPLPTPPPVTQWPSQTQTYTLFAKAEGTFLLYTMGDTSSTGNQLTEGLFGALNVQPFGAEWYRSQVTQEDLKLVTKALSPDGHPQIDYTKVYPAGAKYPDGTLIPANTPVLNMLDAGNNIVHTDLTAMITGPKAGRFPGTSGVNNPETNCNAENLAALNPPPGGTVDPLFCKNPAAPDRKQPYREFTIIYHGALGPVATQAFPVLSNSSTMNPTTSAGQDSFAINYGTGGIGAEIYANRIGVGPMGNCVDCKFEEFFLSAWSVGDPAMLVDVPANAILLPPPPPPPAQPTVPWIQSTTGTATFANGSATVNGVGTLFTSELAVGDVLVLQASPGTARGTVKAITNDTKLTLAVNATANAGGAYLASSPQAKPRGASLPAPLPWLCSGPQLGDKPGTPPNVNCANARVPPAPVVPNSGPPYSLTELKKATRAYYPDDPSNVYHSYINDHLKFRILHGGRDVTHVHHQHAHQWLQSPNSDEASYLDSQMISPGASYTLEMVYNGSGNRNKVVGDSIFHCHFYPHFAAGMWAMWRTHDVFESGSVLVNGIPDQVKGSRALPDGEITAGTPIPAIVPLPTIPMAPLPSDVFIKNGQVFYGKPTDPPDVTDPTGEKKVKQNPGFPFFIPGIAGARPPHPPLDFAPDGAGGFMDGGLPRHVVNGGTVSYESHDQFDWSKDLATMNAIQLPELGTNVEQVAMKYFGQRCYVTFFPDGTPGSCPSSNSTPPQSTLNTPPTGFILNGLPRKNAAGNSAEQLGAMPGAPFADPAVDDNGKAVGTLRRYKAAAIQADVTFNKKGWHYPQQRMLTLWKDAFPTINYTTNSGTVRRQPEPLFFRGNTGDIIEYWHTNLVPNYYVVDDFQVRTPTDILGQHIHLVKFDVTSSDGAGNGFNYEDGTFAPAEVQEVIRAINLSPSHGFVNAPNVPLMDPSSAQYKAKHGPPAEILDCVAQPTAVRCQPCPDGPPDVTPTKRPLCVSWLGAQTTIQRWYLDPQVDDAGVDRTLRTVFTHDHFGPSTHQQAGLYAGLLVEPQGSTWTSNDGLTKFPDPATRSDGGPTSWQARILTSKPADSYREFMLEFQDLQLAYFGPYHPPVANANPKVGWISPQDAINPPSTPSLVTTGVANTPAGTQSVNYTNEPIVSRLAPQNAFSPPSKMIDMSYVFDNSVQEQLNTLLPPSLKVEPDPKTPLLRAYQNDNVQVRVLVGAHVFAHQFNFQGPNWFAEPSWKNSGYRSAQAMGLSEHFEFLFKVPTSSAPTTKRPCPDKMSAGNCVDYLYSPSFDEFGLANGLWGLMRSYDPNKKAIDPATQKTLVEPLPNNPIGAANATYATCPASVAAVKCVPGSGAPCNRVFNISAVTAEAALPNKNLVFNNAIPTNLLQNDLGIMYVRSEDLDGAGKLKPGVPVEPLVLRANAGDCIEVNLTNAIATNSKLFKAKLDLAPPLNGDLDPRTASSYVGLHPQLLAYDAATSSGVNVGWNTQNQPVSTDQLVTVGNKTKYQWYAGKVDFPADGKTGYTPVEFGSLNLFPSDLMFQNPNGLFGSMIIEPAGSTWKCGETANLAGCDPAPPAAPPTSRTSATVTLPNQKTFREFSLMISDAIRVNGDNTGAANYRTEPWNFRYANNITGDFSCMLSNQLQTAQTNPQTALGDPKTPIFTAAVGENVRFRLTHPFGTGTSQVFTLHGHVWQRNPYNTNSTNLGSNSLSQWIGSRDNHGSSDHFDLLIDKAGGEGSQAGDYLYTVFVPIQARNGAWGIFRVGGGPQGPVVPNAGCPAIPKPTYYPVPPKDDLDRFTRQPLNGKKP